MNDKLKVISLINEIDKVVENEYFEDDLIFEQYSGILDRFSDKISEIFKDGLNNNILEMILKIDNKNIFKINNGSKYKDNKIRKEIESYIAYNENLFFDYELIKDNVINNYKIVKYLKEKEKILELINLNEKVLLFADVKYVAKELVLEQMKKSNFLSLVFLGVFGANNNIYRYSNFYSEIDDINNLLYEQLKDVLTRDCYLYIHASDLVKRNKRINELVLSLDPRMIAYTKSDC